jgi:hypothetical protein
MVEGIVDRRGSTISTRCHVALGIITERSRTIGRHITGRIDLPPDSARLILRIYHVLIGPQILLQLGS